MAGNFKESNYGKNRYSTDIVYSSATGDYGLTKEGPWEAQLKMWS